MIVFDLFYLFHSDATVLVAVEVMTAETAVGLLVLNHPELLHQGDSSTSSFPLATTALLMVTQRFSSCL